MTIFYQERELPGVKDFLGKLSLIMATSEGKMDFTEGGGEVCGEVCGGEGGGVGEVGEGGEHTSCVGLPRSFVGKNAPGGGLELSIPVNWAKYAQEMGSVVVSPTVIYSSSEDQKADGFALSVVFAGKVSNGDSIVIKASYIGNNSYFLGRVSDETTQMIGAFEEQHDKGTYLGNMAVPLGWFKTDDRFCTIYRRYANDVYNLIATHLEERAKQVAGSLYTWGETGLVLRGKGTEVNRLSWWFIALVRVFEGMSVCLEEFHQMGYRHGDIKSENFLYTEEMWELLGIDRLILCGDNTQMFLNEVNKWGEEQGAILKRGEKRRFGILLADFDSMSPLTGSQRDFDIKSYTPAYASPLFLALNMKRRYDDHGWVIALDGLLDLGERLLGKDTYWSVLNSGCDTWSLQCAFFSMVTWKRLTRLDMREEVSSFIRRPGYTRNKQWKYLHELMFVKKLEDFCINWINHHWEVVESSEIRTVARFLNNLIPGAGTILSDMCIPIISCSNMTSARTARDLRIYATEIVLGKPRKRIVDGVKKNVDTWLTYYSSKFDVMDQLKAKAEQMDLDMKGDGDEGGAASGGGAMDTGECIAKGESEEHKMDASPVPIDTPTCTTGM